MGFRDFISNRLYRRQIEADFRRSQNIKPPTYPSRQHIDGLVQQLLAEQTAWNARKELAKIGPAAVPSLADALRDPRFQLSEWPDSVTIQSPLESVLGLLVAHGPEYVLAATTTLVDSPSDAVRKIAALNLASLGRVEAIFALGRLLQDADGYVRSGVCTGIMRALSAGRVGEEFRRQAYDLVLAQCDQSWGSATNDAAETAVALDPSRAAVDFASARWLSTGNRDAYRIVKACNHAGILLPEIFVQQMLDHALPLATGAKCYPNQYVAASALTALCMIVGEKARPLLDRALGSDQEEIQEAAAHGIALIAGLHEPVRFALDRAAKVGVGALTPAQQVVRDAFVFDAEVCNGGIMQFFGNTSGNRAAETLDALNTLGHPEAEKALDAAMTLIGPLARERDREKRLAAFEGRFDELRSAFAPLESDYYRTSSRLRQSILLYTARHAAEFRPDRP